MLRFLILAALCDWSSGVLAMLPMPDYRIIGGVYTTIADHPHQASVELYGNQYCGGSIISSSWVVTAASCARTSAAAYTVKVGSAEMYGGTTYSVKRVVRHPLYNSYSFDYNIALLEINGPMQLSATIKPIQLAAREPAADTIVNVTGWGYIWDEGPVSNQLRQLSVPIVDREVCKINYANIKPVTPRMICAGLKNDRKGPCIGDGGGPLSANGILYGILSWSSGCGERNFPAVYNNVANLRPWIRNVTGI